MKLNEIAVEYHDELNKKLWKNNKLISDVRESLMNIATKFVEFLSIDNSFIEDVIITGSNCNYNWTNHSDLDVHLVVNYSNFYKSCQVVNIEEMFKTKKSLWNNEHDISVYGIPVELYVQDTAGNNSSDGVSYSVYYEKWLKEPKKEINLKVDEKSINLKYDSLSGEIKELIKNKVDDSTKIKKLTDKIARMRRGGLAKNGEFGVENLTYKKLRKSGLLDKLYAYAATVEDESLSLEKE